jgi:hypothetical protein
MYNLSLDSNNNGTQSSIQGRGVEAKIVFQNQVHMEIEGERNQHSGEEKEDPKIL